MKKGTIIIALLCAVLLLQGCMYPSSQKAENEIPYDEQIQVVQRAVDAFQEESGGLLPIKTMEESTPIYQKYLIDFSKLKPRYMDQLPGNAFENGGVFQYLLLDVEEDPSVHIFDLRIAEEIRSLQIRIQANRGIPFDKALGGNKFTIDYSKLGYKEEPTVQSPYTNKELPLIAGGDGTIHVDYITDLYQFVQENNIDLNDYKGNEQDILTVLHEESYFVPAYSPQYEVNEENEIIYSSN
ncbi:hypothetical protein [Jeotgalibacillus proteolyticus]|uniref:ABC transporter periplasmic binding protein yphF n=1 Tax=Jeotgalibacillus proteolyticus TaxID=2082395 RepID=A0A2S5GE04_9BACL|nr:hypothetical protein [Jeotgalibacillus proteolyticus]PPA71272.1 hypothetical protein C4B60_04190 [Jeotgalibacillus proteolyticus]